MEEAEKNLSAVGLAPTPEEPCDLVTDKGYHSRDVLKDLDTADVAAPIIALASDVA